MGYIKKVQQVYIIGSKGIPANYGGFETFVEKLTEERKNTQIRYHVASRYDNSPESEKNNHFIHNGADVFSIKVPHIGPAQAVLYDYLALKEAIAISTQNHDFEPIFYVLANRIGPFAAKFARQIHHIGGKFYLNPDGHEWARAKWPLLVKKYWRYSEKKMVAAVDLVIADNPAIETYIQKTYANLKPKTICIAYGTYVIGSLLNAKDEKVYEWFNRFHLQQNGYFLAVGRFVPENNFETMIKEFVASRTKKDFVLVTNVRKNKFFKQLQKKTHFENDSRIKFVGTVYDQELLKYIRQNAFAYLHGHEVGGTNPSLLEALSMTRLNLLIDVPFNRNVAEDAALYWNKQAGQLAHLINLAGRLSDDQIEAYDEVAEKRVTDEFTWSHIVDKYESLFVQ
ncbi:beta 1-4 rhamnosyltransferase Cps2T [Oenococcus sp.]|uniref:beta 1-4 rhamnosyltransferase Cps2T n=1 Tax=Oenococcus sp. TaxID=1979414 RepID=UPI0039E7DD01